MPWVVKRYGMYWRPVPVGSAAACWVTDPTEALHFDDEAGARDQASPMGHAMVTVAVDLAEELLTWDRRTTSRVILDGLSAVEPRPAKIGRGW